MESIVIIVHVIAAIGITGLVLIQQGKGADMGASFGSGASQTVFGSVGSGNALTKATSMLTVVFFVTSLTLALFARQQVSGGVQEESLLQNPSLITVPEQQDLPVVPQGETDSDVPQVQTGADVPEATPAAEAAVDEALQVLGGLTAGEEAVGEEPAAEEAATNDEAAPDAAQEEPEAQ